VKVGCCVVMWRCRFSNDRLQQGHTPWLTRFLIFVIWPLLADSRWSRPSARLR
jgi:hypothetical protein